MSAAYTLTSAMPCIARVSVNARRAPRATRTSSSSSWNVSARGGRAVFAFADDRACRAQRLVMRTALTRVEGVGDEEEPTGSAAAAAANAEGELKDNQVQLPMPRRRAELTFTCNKCEQRGTRMVNPEVYKRGTLFVQCPNPDCAVWHKIVDNLGLIYEFKDVEDDA
uniref:DNL-type domain-containing protein n=1 Tax=Micromonas pusilla TaxID=38833 RepID=A0A7S0PNV7_MICPS|mmetsp:Transcript_2214/g.8422  ORF Transcript_2214/g.8422 Transcript_2214/m.8422 type:complete len:167 (+) Transcript_2214:64-564(+)